MKLFVVRATTTVTTNASGTTTKAKQVKKGDYKINEEKCCKQQKKIELAAAVQRESNTEYP